MRVVNMLDAKTTLSRLVQAIEEGVESEIVIARNGRPAARLVPLRQEAVVGRRLGLLKGVYEAMDLDDFDAENASIRASFEDLWGVKGLGG